MSAKAHYHWTFHAGNPHPTDPTLLVDVVRVVVHGFVAEADARAAAEELIVREVYKLTDIYECLTCSSQREVAAAMTKMANG